MSKAEIERGHREVWRKYDNGEITWSILVQQVSYFAERMEEYDGDRAEQMRHSI